jgi:diketogulonate reductase-like aldo/keto reductase
MLPNIDWSKEDPIGKTPNHKVWAQLEHCVEIGLVKSIGVSNCPTAVLLDILAFCKIKPVINQIELHPYLTQKNFVDF